MALSQSPNVVGKPIPLIDGLRKTTGEGTYTDDIQLPGMLTGKILRSPHAHARITKLDTSKALALPGVHAVVTGREAPRTFGVLPISEDETALAVDKVVFIGDNVAAVAADNEEIALQALRLMEVTYVPLPECRKIDDSLKPAAEPIHPGGAVGTNLHKEVRQHFGDVDLARVQSTLVREAHYEFPGVTHAFTEPHCTVAHYDAGGRLTVWSAQQVPHYLHRALARVLEMPMHRIRVIRPMVGGAFGGKSDPFPHEIVAALLSRKCRRPVKILFDREEVFLNNHGRHPTRTHMAMGMDGAGRFTFLDLHAQIDGGAWGSFGVVTTYYNGVLSMGPYELRHFRYHGQRVYSNKPPSGAMRGHGAVNSRFAMETLIDELCEAADLDPCDVRLRNLLPAHCTTVNGFRITSNGTRECITRARAASEWEKKFRRLPFGRGLGVACGFYISGSAHRIHFNRLPQSTVHLKIDMDGGLTVHCLAAEIGQGSDTMLAQCVAEPLGLKLDRIRIFSGDSDTDPIDLGSYSSRVTFMAGNAAREAALKLRHKLARAAHQLTGYPARGFVFTNEELIYRQDPRVRLSFMQALEQALAGNGALMAKGIYNGPPPMGGNFKGARAGLSPSYSFQCYIAEVTVDTETFEPRVEKVWAAHDCGKALNPLAVAGQIEGCIHMGLGQALTEEMAYNRSHVLAANFLDYRTLTPLQMPEVEVIIVESNDPEGPYGAKEAGEGPLLPILPAVANAIYDAVGVRMRSLPMTADKIWKAFYEKRETRKVRPRAVMV